MAENNSSTVNKAIDILEIFLQKDGEISLTEVAKLTHSDVSTVYRLVSTLKKRKFLYQARRNGKYTLGLKMIDFSFAVRRNLHFVDLAYLYLGKINTAFSAAVNLAILDVDKSLMVEEAAISSKGATTSKLKPKRLSLYATACGKVLLSYMSEADRKNFYANNVLKPFTSNTITNINNLESELTHIRKTGVAYDFEEFKLGLTAVAVPVFNKEGELLAAASIMLPDKNTDKAGLKEYTQALKKCGEDLTRAVSELN
jgi:IclR family transcriptional regulator, KDG regulon repressor